MSQGLLLSHIDLAIDDTEWLVVKLKGDSECAACSTAPKAGRHWVYVLGVPVLVVV